MALTVNVFAGNGVVSQVYTGNVVASGGTGPYTYAVTAGSLPPGLSLDPATGNITGVPTTVGDFDATITATDSLLVTGTADLPISIIGAPIAARISARLGNSIDSSCLPEGRKFITKTWQLGRLPYKPNTSLIPNDLNSGAGATSQFEWNLLDGFQGNREFSIYETLVISIAELNNVPITDFMIYIDTGNGIPIWLGETSRANQSWYYAALPLLSDSTTIKIGIQIDTGALAFLPADLGVLTLTVANFKIKPFVLQTGWGI